MESNVLQHLCLICACGFCAQSGAFYRTFGNIASLRSRQVLNTASELWSLYRKPNSNGDRLLLLRKLEIFAIETSSCLSASHWFHSKKGFRQWSGAGQSTKLVLPYFSLSPGDALHRAWQSNTMSKYTGTNSSRWKSCWCPSAPKAQGHCPSLQQCAGSPKCGLGSRNKAVSSRLAVVVPRIILV